MAFPLVLVVALSLSAAQASIDLGGVKGLLPGYPGCADVPCLLEHAYLADPEAKDLALALWKESGDLAGLGPEEVMDGGFRGAIHLVPQLPILGYRKHLGWVVDSTRTIDKFFATLFKDQVAPQYRWRSVTFRFVRSVNKHRPSAYASGWAVEYNVEGSLLKSSVGVRDTLFHELFHANDDDHGDWSASHLRHDYAAILARCGPK